MFKGLGNKLRQLFSQTLGHFMEETKEWIQERISNGIIFFLEVLEKHQLELTKPIIDEIENAPELPESIRKTIRELKKNEYEAGSVLLGSIGVSAVGGVAGTVFQALMAPVTNKLRAAIPATLLGPSECAVANWRLGTSEEFIYDQLRKTGYTEEQINILLYILRPLLSPDELARLLVRGEISKEEYRKTMASQGFTEQQSDQLFSLYRSLLGVGECRELLLRGEIPEKEHDTRLKQLGFNETDIAQLKKLYFYIPSPGDLVRMAVREAWTEKTVQMFGYDEDFPEEFAKWSEKQGMSRDWAKRYWRAHWELPSPTMGYEMLHREIITEEELDTLLKTADYPEFWRKKMMKLSYSPYTRVDVRRMYQTGILTRDEVFQAYKDIGYDDERAENLTKFTVAGASQSEKDLTKSELLRGYKYKILSAEETKENLIKMGYDPDEAEYYIALQDYQEEKERKEDLINRTKTEFTKGIISRNEVYKRLGEANLQAKEIEYYLSIWNVSRETKPRQPSLTDLKAMFKARVINESTFREEVSNMGYSDRYVDWYVKVLNLGVGGE